MDHKAFLAGLPPETRTALTRRSTARGLLHLAGHLALIGLTGLGIAQGGLVTAIALPLHGILLVFLFTLLHETTHRTPFAHDSLNDWVGRMAGAVLFIGFTWFRHFHFAHHRHTNDPARDPELSEPKPETRAALIWHLSGLPLWGSSLKTLVATARGTRHAYVPDRAQGMVRTEARLLLGLYTLLALSLIVTPALWWYWLLPILLGQPVLRLYLLAEHDRCPEVTDMFRNTRTTVTTAALRFIAWNMPYHAEHHTLPSAPFHQLPNLHARMAEHLRVTAPGYTAFAKDRIATTP